MVSKREERAVARRRMLPSRQSYSTATCAANHWFLTFFRYVNFTTLVGGYTAYELSIQQIKQTDFWIHSSVLVGKPFACLAMTSSQKATAPPPRFSTSWSASSTMSPFLQARMQQEDDLLPDWKARMQQEDDSTPSGWSRRMMTMTVTRRIDVSS